METILLISLGAIVGANLRYFLALAISRVYAGFPFGTLAINITGSLALGFFMVWTGERVIADPRWRLLIAVGLCGGYTTYSTYAYETFALCERGQWMGAALNVVGTNVLCLVGVVAGALVARGL